MNYSQPSDEVLVKKIQAYTRGFWKGLFICYDAPHVPRTNNDHERFFRQTKTKHRRMTGRRSWNDYILRSGEFVVFVDDAIKQPNILERLRSVDDLTFDQERKRRFRKNPATYLQDIETRMSELIGRSFFCEEKVVG